MKYKVGDKVRVRNDLKVNNNYGDYVYCGNMPFFKGKTVTIKAVTDFKYDKHYLITEDDGRYYWTDKMFEDVNDDEAEIVKFRAFLEEVANLHADGYDEEYTTLARIIEYGQDGYDGYNYKEFVDELCNFYRTFTPKKETKKKMTKAEIEAELGYKIEIVEK